MSSSSPEKNKLAWQVKSITIFGANFESKIVVVNIHLLKESFKFMMSTLVL